MDFLTDTLKELSFLVENFGAFAAAGGWKYLVMWVIGGILIYLAIRRDMEPTLLLPCLCWGLDLNFPEIRVR